jgi:hypothetical protein
MARAGLALVFGLITLGRIDGQPLVEAAAPLAIRISSLLPPRAIVALELQVLTPLVPESASFRGALEEQLRKLGLNLAAAPPADLRLRVDVAENVRGLLFVAEVLDKDTRQIVMLPWSRALSADAKPSLRLVSKPVWAQPEPILDSMILDSDSQLLMLSPTKVTSLRLAGGKWSLNGQASLMLDRPVPRDPRGRLEFISGALRVYLPGTSCSGQLAAQIAFTCAPGNEPWRINPQEAAATVRWTDDTNVLASGDVKNTFYNAAQGLFASVNGNIQDRAGVAAPGTEDWGSDLASLANPCAAGNVLIVSVAGDNRERGEVRAFEMISGQPVARSDVMFLPGPVTALWPAEIPSQATLVVRNSKTGNYEASRLALACAE